MEETLQPSLRALIEWLREPRVRAVVGETVPIPLETGEKRPMFAHRLGKWSWEELGRFLAQRDNDGMRKCITTRGHSGRNVAPSAATFAAGREKGSKTNLSCNVNLVNQSPSCLFVSSVRPRMNRRRRHPPWARTPF